MQGSGFRTGRLRHPRLWRAGAFAVLALVVWLSLTPAPPSPPVGLSWDKAQHALAYAVLAWWFAQAWRRRVPTVALLLFVIGLVLEGLQGLGGERTMSLADAAANGVGVALGLVIVRTPLGRVFEGIETGAARWRRP
ncbi:hypothetical protein KBTX_01421 [wastewater metagenome]|uniref:VanZ-like domain-containing protein n=2 Tax=unclassified sequences TaxID=12908 RepID=A0A5B8RCG9_9ZZZZ|nr:MULTISPECIES: hypothetical protein [Arhodomonas]QEA05102.1 hypothetical protein KBTEX_01421 [uncultured organism]